VQKNAIPCSDARRRLIDIFLDAEGKKIPSNSARIPICIVNICVRLRDQRGKDKDKSVMRNSQFAIRNSYEM